MFNDKFVVTNIVSIVECTGKSKTDVFMFSIIEIRDYPHILYDTLFVTYSLQILVEMKMKAINKKEALIATMIDIKSVFQPNYCYGIGPNLI